MLYDYVCDDCLKEECDVFQSINDKPKVKCSECGKHSLRRIISGGAFSFVKGSGGTQKLPQDTKEPKESVKKERKRQWYDNSGSATRSEISEMTKKQKQNYIKGGSK
jgi:putative FmdB family regulatory protein